MTAFVSRALTARAGGALSVVLLASAALSGCSATSQAEENGSGPTSSESATVRTNARGEAVPVDTVVRVRADQGVLTEVTVEDAAGVELPGELSEDGRLWRATGRLEPGTAYVVNGSASDGNGGEKPVTRRFTTQTLDRATEETFASVAPLAGSTVGVGMPVIVTFDVPVTDHAAFEKHMDVTSTPAQKGSWHWLSDNEAHWRPATYWQAGTDVHVDIDVNSIAAGGGVYGQESRQIDFSVGDAHVYKVNAQTHQMQVYSNGELIRTIPITTGKDGFITRSGVKVIIEKFEVKHMRSETVGIANPDDPEFYDLDDVQWAMRLTYSGEFIHAAPWSVGSQGYANVSHGCTGMSTENAAWLYAMTIPGDVVEYVGTDRPMTLENGYGDWNLSYADYKAGSAL